MTTTIRLVGVLAICSHLGGLVFNLIALCHFPLHLVQSLYPGHWAREVGVFPLLFPFLVNWFRLVHCEHCSLLAEPFFLVGLLWGSAKNFLWFLFGPHFCYSAASREHL